MTQGGMVGGMLAVSPRCGCSTPSGRSTDDYAAPAAAGGRDSVARSGGARRQSPDRDTWAQLGPLMTTALGVACVRGLRMRRTGRSWSHG
jgi:hypothetical protein